MKTFSLTTRVITTALALGLAATAFGQVPGDGPPPDGFFPGGPGGPPGRFGPPGGFGRMGQTTKLLEKFDKDGDGRLDAEERKAAREYLKTERGNGRGPGRMRFPGFNRQEEKPEPGEKISPDDVKAFPDRPVYDPETLRTFFLQFEDTDWESEMADFNNTDVEMPATLTVDGKTYPDVGVHFRGMSSFMMVPEGRKRSLNLSLNWIHKGQDIDHYNTFNLLNSHEDPSFLRSVLFYEVARHYLPAPKANFVRVVINGENWGVYVNVQQFNKDFVKDWFDTKKGARWKVPGSPGGRGSLAYIGDDVDRYKEIYTIKSKDDPEDWAAFIKMVKVLNETPADQLEEKLSPLLDIDGALRFLALDISLINNDGYWIRTSDYSIYMDRDKKFHVIPQDANETFALPGGPGFGRGGPGGPRGRRGGPGFGPGTESNAEPVDGIKLDPLYIANDENKPLASKLLAVPALRERYLGYVRDIAENWLDWNKLGPIAEKYHNLIADDVKRDTRKLDSTEDFEKSLTENIRGSGGPGPRETIGIKNFADQRRDYLLNLPAIKALKP